MHLQAFCHGISTDLNEQSGQWSSNEEMQTIGRLWRDGQLEDVFVHHVLSPGTADELINGLAHSKLVMGGWFTGGLPLEVIFDSENEDSEDEAELLTEADHKKVAKRTRKKPCARALKATQQVEAIQSPAEEVTQTSTVVSGPSSRKRKLPEEVDPAPKPGSSHGDRKGKAAPRTLESKKQKTSQGADLADVPAALGDVPAAPVNVPVVPLDALAATQKPRPRPRPKPKVSEPAVRCDVESSSATTSKPIIQSSSSSGKGPSATAAHTIPTLLRKAHVPPEASPRLDGSVQETGKGKQRVDLAPGAGEFYVARMTIYFGTNSALPYAGQGNKDVEPMPATSAGPKNCFVSDAVNVDEDVDVDGDWYTGVFDLDAASQEWKNSPAADSECGPMAPGGAVAVSLPVLTPAVQDQASRRSSEPEGMPSASIQSSRPSKPMPPPVAKTNRFSAPQRSSASQPEPSGSTSSRSTAAVKRPVPGSSSQPDPSKSTGTVSAKRPGQFRVNKPLEQAPSSRAIAAKHKRAAVDRADSSYQRGEVLPRSPSRGRRPAPGVDDFSSSPPLKASRHR